MIELSGFYGNQLIELLRYIEKDFIKQGNEMQEITEKLELQGNVIRSKSSRRQANKCYKLSDLFSEYLHYIGLEILDNKYLPTDKENIKNLIYLLSFSLKVSSRIRSYKNHYSVHGIASIKNYNKMSEIKVNFDRDCCFSDVLDETDKRIKNVIKILKKNLKKNEKLKDETISNNSKDNNLDNIRNVFFELEKLRKDTINHIYLVAVSEDNDNYNVLSIIGDYKNHYDFIISQLSSKERKKIDHEKYSTSSIIESANLEIISNMMIKKHIYNQEHKDEYLKLNTCLMSAEMIIAVFNKMLTQIKKETIVDTRYLQINFIRAIFPKLKDREIYKEDDLLTYEIAVNICRDYLEVEPCFKNEDFIIPNDKQLQEPKKHR